MFAEKVKIGFVSLGCAKNLVDSQNIITLLLKAGYEVGPDCEGADAVIINTCGFIEPAVDESMEAIGEALERCGKVVVTGCLGPRRDFILERYPEVRAVSGPHVPEEVLRDVNRLFPERGRYPGARVAEGGVLLTPGHYAYLKISEGCSHRCSFCVIPRIRGDLVSFDPEKILNLAEAYVKRGVKELLVVAQDTTAWGADRKYQGFRGHERGDLYALTRELAKLGVWQRVHYSYPYPHVTKLVEQMAEGLVLPYMDVPMQHVSSRVLGLMKRPGSHLGNLEAIRLWRSICPELTIRSTFIVGFPGETEEEFCELLDFIREARLDRVGCFKYSAILHAAANDLPGQVPEEVKEERYDRFMTVQQRISEEILAGKVGRKLEVIVDEAEPGGITGRTKGDAPEIDGIVRLRQGSNLRPVGPGDIVTALITGSDEYDLEGEIV